MLEKLIQQGEGENQDFKQKISNLFKISKTIVSFANTTGGKLLIGVCDNKFIMGVDPEEEKYMLTLAADSYCDPPVKLIFQEEEIEEENKIVLIVQIDESAQKPHFAKQPDDNWVAYVRVKDKSIPAGKILLKGLMQQSSIASSPESEIITADLSKNEKQLLEFLELNDSTTLKQVMKLQNFSKRRAARMLTALVNKNVIRIHEHEKEPFYTK